MYIQTNQSNATSEFILTCALQSCPLFILAARASVGEPRVVPVVASEALALSSTDCHCEGVGWAGETSVYRITGGPVGAGITSCWKEHKVIKHCNIFNSKM